MELHLRSGPTKLQQRQAARDVTGFYAFSPPGNRAIFSTFWGYLLTEKKTRKREKSTGENSKKASGEGTPKLQISVPCRGRICNTQMGDG